MPRVHDDWIKAYLEYTSNTEPSELYRKWAAVSTIAAVLRRKTWLDWHNRIFPNLYIVLVGPAAARKGTAMDPPFTMLRELGISLAANSTTRQALVKAIKKSASGVDVINEHEGIIIKPHASLTIFNSELVVLIGYANREFLSDLCDWYDCKDKWEKDTLTQGSYFIDNIWVNLFGATTPELMQQAIPIEVVGSGFVSRTIFPYADGPGRKVLFPMLKKDGDGHWTKAPSMIDEKDPVREAIVNDLRFISMISGPFQVSDEYLEVWGRWYANQDVKEFRYTPLESYLGRRQTHVQKLAMIISAARRESKLITAQDLKDAISMIEEVEVDMLKSFGSYGKSDLADVQERVMRIIATDNQTNFTTIFRQVYKDLGRDELYQILKNLAIIGFCEFEHQSGNVKFIPSRSSI